MSFISFDFFTMAVGLFHSLHRWTTLLINKMTSSRVCQHCVVALI